jgi:outer membrane protein assembly factor BamB
MRNQLVATLASVTGMNAHARRRSFGGPVIAVLLGLIVALHFPADIRAADWPQFLGPNRNGSISPANLAAAWPKEGPVTVWQHKVGEGFAGPVVSAGKLIVFHRIDGKEVVECLDAKSGKELWRGDYPARYRDDFGFEEGPRATPAVANGRVFTFGANGDFTAWDLAKGTKLWSIDTRAQFKTGKGFFGIACSPLVEGNTVILNIGGKDGAGIVAFDVATGKNIWQATDDEASYASPVAATLGGKRRILVITREALVALNAADGSLVFRHAWRPPMHASVSAATPLVIGDDIFISASYGTGASLLRFKESAPEVIWSKDEVLSAHYATAVQRDGFLYGFDGRQEQGCELRCVELKTGKVLWSEGGLKAGTVTFANDQLLILTERGELIQAPASPAGFKPTQRAQILPFTVRAHPAVADGFFYARSKDKLVCVDLRAAPSPKP